MAEGDTAPVIGSALPWISDRPVALDFGGPQDVTYVPVPTAGGQSDGLKWFERSVERFAHKTAISDDRVSLTYAQLLDRVNGLAVKLDAEVPPGAIVATVFYNGAACAVAMMAVRATGRTLVAIDAGHPIERQAAIFACSAAGAIVVEAGAGADISFAPESVTCLTLDVTAASGVSSDQAPRSESSGAYVAFTSGSTGSPKGLVHEVRPTAIARMVDKFHLNANDVFISLASMSQTGLADLVGLSVGATVHVVDMKRRGFMEAVRVMGRERVTFLSFVPSVLRPMLAIPGVEQAISALRVLDLHGEAILKSDIDLLRSKLSPDCHICVTYGSTEVGAVFSWFVRDEAIQGAVSPIGYLSPDKSVALVAEDGSPTPAGEVGELLVRGPMALGSWDYGRISDARFMVDPDSPGKRIYGMGDLVRQRPDGLFEFAGRRDRQTKIRGLWVDLSKVEEALRAAQGVSDAVVVVKSAPDGADSLAAFVVPLDQNRAPRPAALRRDVAGATADHMAPGEIHLIEAIPRLANYKPDLVKLAALLR